MKLSKIRLCLFGTSILNEYISQNYKKNHIEHMCIITHKDDKRDIELLSKYKLFPEKKKIKCEVYYLTKYNENKIIKILKKNKINFGISIGCRLIFKNTIIKYFRKNFYNIHDSFLPYYKGGAPISYSIMNQEKFIGVTFHRIDKKIDNGKVFHQKKLMIKKDTKPIEAINFFFNYVKRNIFKFINGNKKIITQRKTEGTYFPRLNSEIDGYINLNWPANECVSFINSFSDPYTGAKILYNNNKIQIKDAKIFSNKKYHSFLNGKIVYIGTNYIRVIMGNKIIELKNLFLNNKIIIPKYFFKTGGNFINSETDLKISKNLRIKYF